MERRVRKKDFGSLILLIAMTPLFFGCLVSSLAGFSTSEDSNIVETSVEREEEFDDEVVHEFDRDDEVVSVGFARGKRCTQRQVQQVEYIETRHFNPGLVLIDIGLGILFAIPDHSAWGVGVVYAIASPFGWLRSREKSTRVVEEKTGPWESVDCQGEPVAGADAQIWLGNSKLFEGRTDGQGQVSFSKFELESALLDYDRSPPIRLQTRLQPEFVSWEMSRRLTLPTDYLPAGE